MLFACAASPSCPTARGVGTGRSTPLLAQRAEAGVGLVRRPNRSGAPRLTPCFSAGRAQASWRRCSSVHVRCGSRLGALAGARRGRTADDDRRQHQLREGRDVAIAVDHLRRAIPSAWHPIRRAGWKEVRRTLGRSVVGAAQGGARIAEERVSRRGNRPPPWPWAGWRTASHTAWSWSLWSSSGSPVAMLGSVQTSVPPPRRGHSDGCRPAGGETARGSRWRIFIGRRNL